MFDAAFMCPCINVVDIYNLNGKFSKYTGNVMGDMLTFSSKKAGNSDAKHLESHQQHIMNICHKINKNQAWLQ